MSDQKRQPDDHEMRGSARKAAPPASPSTGALSQNAVSCAQAHAHSYHQLPPPLPPGRAAAGSSVRVGARAPSGANSKGNESAADRWLQRYHASCMRCVWNSRHDAAVLATALKRSQSNIVEVQARMQLQQEQHVQHCRQSAEAKSKMLRLFKLQRRVQQLAAAKMQQRLKCARAGAMPLACQPRLHSASMPDCACSAARGAGGGSRGTCTRRCCAT
jgi:hypothetical protein